MQTKALSILSGCGISARQIKSNKTAGGARRPFDACPSSDGQRLGLAPAFPLLRVYLKHG
jgi:hypothetical protein